MTDESIENTFEPLPDEPAVEEPQAEVVEAAAEEPVVEAEPVVEPKVEEKPQATVPVDLYVETRAKLKALEAERAQVPVEAPQIPDVLDDQAGFTQSIQSQVQNATLNARLDVSEMMAREANGDELVDAAVAAAKAANIVGQFTNKKHAYGDLVKWHKQQMATAEIGSDVDAWKERIRAEIEADVKAKLGVKETAAAIVEATPSLAGATSIGARTPPAAPDHTPLGEILG
jgi:hypothetical protein